MNVTSAWWHWLAMSLWGCYHGDVKLKALLCVREQPHRAAGVAADPSQFHRTQGDIIITRLSWKVWLFGLSTQYMTSTNRGHILCSDFVNRGGKTIRVPPRDWCQAVCLTDENLCSCEGRSVLGWPSVPFGSDVFTPSACCWRWEAAGRKATDVRLSWLINSRI